MEDIVKEAEEAIKKSRIERRNVRTGQTDLVLMLKTSQIRKFLTAVNSIRNEISSYKVQHPGTQKLPEDIAAQIKFLKVKAAYQMGREKAVKDFMLKAEIMKKIDAIGDDMAAFDLFANYMEALVAYHKFYGGKD